MRRRHVQREELLMRRRWLEDTRHHRWNDWYCDLYGLPRDDCACLRGYGYYRKIRRENVERGSGWVSFKKRHERRKERYEATDEIREQMIESLPSRVVGLRRVGFRWDWLD